MLLNPCDPVTTTSQTTALVTVDANHPIVLRTKRALPLAIPWIAAFLAPLLLELGIHLPLAVDESAKTRRWRAGVEKLAKELVSGLGRHDTQLKTVSYEKLS